MKRQFLKHLLSAILLASPLWALAEDIDLFVSRNSSVDAPNVLLVIDNGANFSASVSTQVCRISASGNVYTSTSGGQADNIAANATALNGTAGAVEQCGLYSVINSMDTSAGVKINVGVMVFNANNMLSVNPVTNRLESVCVNGTGGCLVYPIVPLNAANKASLLTWIKNWKTSGNDTVGGALSSGHNIKGNNTASGAVMQEAWAYYKGKTGISGRNYSTVKPDSPCGKDYVIFLGNAYRNNSTPGDSTGDAGPMTALYGTNTVSGKNANPAATAAQKAIYNDTITTSCGTNTLEASENKGIYALNWVRYMNEQHKMTTYSIGILGPTCNGEYAAHLSKMGETAVGNGKYFATNSFAELITALKTVLGEIQSVNSVFASVSLPVSVNTQGTYLNQVYVGMFRPDATIAPRWAGNLKQYKLGLVNNTLQLQDADSKSAVNSSTGFITDCARSFWTPTTVDSYWSNGSSYQKGSCDSIANSAVSNYPDGNIVEKGAQAYQLRSTTARTVKTCSPTFGSCTAMTDFATTNAAITQALLDSTNTINRTSLIDWARGINVSNELSKGTTVMRPSAHGDVVHSRPVAINHGSEANPEVVVYYGTNDGMLHAVNGNRTNSITSGGATYAAGMELWSFMPPEFYSNIKRLYSNSPTIQLKTTNTAGELPKPYGFDGPITAYKSGSTTWLYPTMRRGGRALYAFDVSTPGSPTLKWKRGCPNNFPTSGTVSDTDCTNNENGDFRGLGQTWSAAKPVMAAGHQSGTSPLLLIGGGYDTCEDTDDGTVNHSCTGTNGNKIYVLDADTGTALKIFSTQRAVTGDVSLVRDSVTGMLKYAYATDLGGNVYRISGVNDHTAIGSTAPANWTITRIASLGCATTSACSANRKFMFAPDVVYDNGMYVLLIGSGDREKPISNYTTTYGVRNYFFMIKDKPEDTNWLSSESDNCGSSIICLNSLLGITTSASPSQADVDLKKGWYLGLAAHEQVVTTSVTVFGTVTFSTHQPATTLSSSCGANLGTALVYNLYYTNAASANGTDNRYQDVGGDGLPPSPVAGQVTLDDGSTVPFCIGCSPSSPLEGTLKTAPASSSASTYKSRTYWYIEK